MTVLTEERESVLLDRAQQVRYRASFQHTLQTELVYRVAGEEEDYQVTFFPGSRGECTCGQPLCDHLAVALKKARQDGRLESFQRKMEFRLGKDMLGALTRAMPGGEGVKLSAVLRLYPDHRVGLGLSVGQEKLYAVKSISDLVNCYVIGAELEISDKFVYMPSAMRFSKADARLLALLANELPMRAHSVADWEESSERSRETDPRREYATDGRFLILTGSLLNSVMRYFETREFVLGLDGEKIRQSQIRTVDLPLVFSLSMTPTEIAVRVNDSEQVRIITPDGRYVVFKDRLVHIHSAQARICKLISTGGNRFRYAAKEAEEVLYSLLPSLSAVGTVIPDPEIGKRLAIEKMVPSVYVDLEGTQVVARVEFRYGETLLNPFQQEEKEGERRLLLRDGKAESEIINLLSEYGFSVRSGKVVLKKSRDILSFCTQGIVELGKKCDIYASGAFEKVKPRKARLHANFRMKNGHLVLSLLEENGLEVDTGTVLRAIAQRQQYVHLKTGEFLDIRDLSGFENVTQEVLEAASIDRLTDEEDERELSFGAYRTAYLVTMLRSAGVEVEETEEVSQTRTSFTRQEEEGVSHLSPTFLEKLTDYQKRGCNWLFSLYEARMGGILADEMGLGKTVQVIAALSAARRRDGAEKSVIITPTSLTYHWLAEFKRFDEALSVRLITGPREERRRQIEEISQDPEVDVVLTTYPLFRRDVDLLKTIPFRFAILDEAQSVKNAQSQGAFSAKQLQARGRVALTGTPMENQTGELWSLFDFVLPGYLGTQPSFLHRYGGGENTEELRERIRPFLMRRMKKDVLQGLPEKHETMLYATLTPEQEKVYLDLLGSLRTYVGAALEDGSVSRARIQVLSMLMKLRQACCHPRLLLDNYEGTSGKMELLISTIHNALEDKHRVLVFSQFVGMLHLIRKRLSREGISPLYLDGETKAETRQELCDRFNGGEGKVFLISLKAGGTGLNLTGADYVIHYDPWWNPATEDQATDRAHRIGQSRDVEVVRLISQGTIEEKVAELSQKKRSLFDKVVMAGETSLSSLTEEEIRYLFFTD